jgi:hypothetical protein
VTKYRGISLRVVPALENDVMSHTVDNEQAIAEQASPTSRPQSTYQNSSQTALRVLEPQASIFEDFLSVIHDVDGWKNTRLVAYDATFACAKQANALVQE